MSVSIIIPAFKADLFIDECLNSIQRQTVSFEYEVLIGIDGCNTTLEHLTKNAYGRNIRIFYFDENKGPYVIKNSLTEECQYENILFFDADDIMLPGALSEFERLIQKYDLVRLSYQNFYNGSSVSRREAVKNDATFGVRKAKFEKINGFYPWICSADTEFVKRATVVNGWSETATLSVCYNRRLHGANLTMDAKTNFDSSIRKEYDEQIKFKKRVNPEIKTIQSYKHVENINAQTGVEHSS